MTRVSNTIHLKGEGRHEEALAGEAGIYPGMLLKKDSAGAVIKHATEGGVAERMLATEDALQGKTVEDVYTNATIVSHKIFERGAVALAMIKAGQNISIGEHLISGGDGTLVSVDEADSADNCDVIAISEEAIDLSGEGDVNTLSSVRFV